MIKAAQLAEKLGSELKGDPDVVVSGIKPLNLAGPNDLSFFAPTTKKNQKELYSLACSGQAGIILVNQFDEKILSTQILAKNPLGTVIHLAPLFYTKPRPAVGIHPHAVIHPTANIGTNVAIDAFCVIGENATIGDNTVLFPHVVVYAGASIGSDCVIHSFATIREFVSLGNDCLIQNGVVVGGDGFGYIPDPQLGHRRIPHVGVVVLEDGVDLGANATVDRATLGETRIKRGAKLDNLVMVGHNCQIGRASLLCSQVGVSGSSTVGDNVILGGQVGLADHVTLGDKVRVSAKGGITNDVAAGTDMAGYPATEASRWRREVASTRQLPELIRRLKQLEKKLEQYETK